MIRLIVQDRTGHVLQAIPLGRHSRLSVGRAADNNVVLPWEGVSRYHARLVRRSGVLWLEDRGSKNGFFVEGKPTRRLELVFDHPVQVGGGYLVVEDVATLDDQVGIEVGDQEPQPLTGVGGATRTAPASSHASPAAALGFLAHLLQESQDKRHRRRDWLACAAALGANGLFHIRHHGGEVEVLEGVGRWLPEQLDSSEAAQLPLHARGDSLVAFADAATPPHWWTSALALFARAYGMDMPPSATVPTGEAFLATCAFPSDMVPGNSAAMRGLYEQIAKAHDVEMPALVQGPTGSGKDLVARLIHRTSPRAEGPFVAINCAELSGDLLESELFGIGAGVATNVHARKGRIRQANGGTLFIDEIGDMPPPVQVKLLRVFEDRVLWPVGGKKPVQVNFRLVVATHQDLERRIEEGHFREDLYYRLAGLLFAVPSLNERREDIPELALHFLKELAPQKRVRGLSRHALDQLMAADWPGNIRQLRLILARAVARARPGELIGSHLLELREPIAPEPNVSKTAIDPQGEVPVRPGGTLREHVERVERRAILEALRQTGGNRTTVARRLDLSRQGLRDKMRRLGIDRKALWEGDEPTDG